MLRCIRRGYIDSNFTDDDDDDDDDDDMYVQCLSWLYIHSFILIIIQPFSLSLIVVITYLSTNATSYQKYISSGIFIINYPIYCDC